MLRTIALLLTPLALTAALTAAAAEPELRVGHARSWSMPWGRVDGQRVVGGINHDLPQAVARRLGMPLRWVLMPQAKGDTADGDRDIDLRCGIDPSWTRRPEAYHWSEPLFDTSDQLIGHVDAPPLRSLSELPIGSVVGTVGGYRYPTLEARFAAGTLRRDDAPDQERVLGKLTRRRTPYAAVSPQALAWYLRHQSVHELASWRVRLQQSAYYCAVPQTSKLDPERVLDAVHALQRDGELQRILDSYAPGR